MRRVPFRQINYRETSAPITEPITKFGGQPVWIDGPSWPLSRSTGRPMRFICQVYLDPSLFGQVTGRMAYIFVSDFTIEEQKQNQGNTYEMDGGENAVVVQPGRPYVPSTALTDGPSLRRYVSPGSLVDTPCEFRVELTEGEEPPYDPAHPGFDENDPTYEDQFLLVDKIGGSPHFVQYPEFPEGAGWRLLIQFGQTPCELPFGGGYAYVFLSKDGASGKMVWQK